MGHTAGLNGRKISSPPGFDPRTTQPVGNLYTDYAIPAHLPNMTSLTGIRVLLYWHIYIYIYIHFFKVKIYYISGKNTAVIIHVHVYKVQIYQRQNELTGIVRATNLRLFIGLSG